MIKKKLLIGEPWDFVNPHTENSIIEVIYEQTVIHKDVVAEIYVVTQPFYYNDYYIKRLILHSRHNPKTSTYNIHVIKDGVEYNSDVESKYIFIGDLLDINSKV